MSKNKIRGLIALTMILIASTPAFCASPPVEVTTSAVLAELLEIEKVIVSGTPYNPGNPGDFLTNMTKTTVTPVNTTTNSMAFTPVTVKIKTNRVQPIVVNASFDELRHIATSTLIPIADLSVTPTSEDIPNPFNGIVTNPFTFTSLIRTTTLTGPYEGTITFTVLPVF